jgi:aspartyl-tRNA(Asn)/glutamyl-tRNA(Gln) amidotransferase subunit C
MTGMAGFMVRPLHAPKGFFMSLDPATIRRIARLARIRLDEAEIPRVQADLNGILAWVEMLNEVNVANVDLKPEVNAALWVRGGKQHALWLRPDVVDDGGIRDAILENAPDRADGFFAVPKVVE